MTKPAKLPSIETSSKEQKLFDVSTLFAERYLSINFEHIGKCTNRRAHKCLCEMEKTDLKRLGTFLHKIHHTKKEDDVFKKWKSDDSNLKYKGDQSRQIKHLPISDAFRLHGYVEDGAFYLVAIDPTHEDGKN